MTPDFSRREVDLHEHMDRPDCDLQALQRTYARFKTVNALLSGWRQVYLREVRPLLEGQMLKRRGAAKQPSGPPLTLLDIGCGGGDVALNFANWARRDGLKLNITAIDADDRSIEYASNFAAHPDIQFRQGMSGDLVQEAKRFDFVISNHLLHHLTAPELAALLQDSERLCRVKVIHGDIERSPVAYAAFDVCTRLFFQGTFIREDGLLSIRRSYTCCELAGVAPSGWRVQQQLPFRNLLTYQAAANA